MKYLVEIIKALYSIKDAIKEDDKNNGGEQNSNDNGLYGADGIIVLDGDNNNNDVFLSQKELIDDFKENSDKYANGEYGRRIVYLYTKSDIDKLLKPIHGMIAERRNIPAENFRFYTDFLNQNNLSLYELDALQNLESFSDYDKQKIIEKLGNNVYVFKYIQ